MEFYMSPRRNGTSVRLPITGMTVAYERGLTIDDKPITKRVLKSRVRYGKTERDRLNGNVGRSAARRAARAHWQRDADKNNPSPFPV